MNPHFTNNVPQVNRFLIRYGQPLQIVQARPVQLLVLPNSVPTARFPIHHYPTPCVNLPNVTEHVPVNFNIAPTVSHVQSIGGCENKTVSSNTNSADSQSSKEQVFVIGPAFSLADGHESGTALQGSDTESNDDCQLSPLISNVQTVSPDEFRSQPASVPTVQTSQEPQICIGSVFSLAENHTEHTYQQEKDSDTNLFPTEDTAQERQLQPPDEIVPNLKKVTKNAESHSQIYPRPFRMSSAAPVQLSTASAASDNTLMSQPSVSSISTHGNDVLPQAITTDRIKTCTTKEPYSSNAGTVTNSAVSNLTSTVPTQMSFTVTDTRDTHSNSSNEQPGAKLKPETEVRNSDMIKTEDTSEKPAEHEDIDSVSQLRPHTSESKKPEVVDLDTEDIDDCMLVKIDFSRYFPYGSKIHNSKVVIDDSDNDEESTDSATTTMDEDIPSQSDCNAGLASSRQTVSSKYKKPHVDVCSAVGVNENIACEFTDPLNMEVDEVESETESSLNNYKQAAVPYEMCSAEGTTSTLVEVYQRDTVASKSCPTLNSKRDRHTELNDRNSELFLPEEGSGSTYGIIDVTQKFTPCDTTPPEPELMELHVEDETPLSTNMECTPLKLLTPSKFSPPDKSLSTRIPESLKDGASFIPIPSSILNKTFVKSTLLVGDKNAHSVKDISQLHLRKGRTEWPVPQRGNDTLEIVTNLNMVTSEQQILEVSNSSNQVTQPKSSQKVLGGTARKSTAKLAKQFSAVEMSKKSSHDRSTKSNASSLETVRESSERSVMCKICFMSFSSRMDLVTHTWNCHRYSKNCDNNASYKCGRCDKVFNSMSLLKLHYKVKCTSLTSPCLEPRKVVVNMDSLVQNFFMTASSAETSKKPTDSSITVKGVDQKLKAGEGCGDHEEITRETFVLAKSDQHLSQRNNNENTHDKQVNCMSSEMVGTSIHKTVFPNKESFNTGTEINESQKESCFSHVQKFRSNVVYEPSSVASSAGNEQRSEEPDGDNDVKTIISSGALLEHNSHESEQEIAVESGSEVGLNECCSCQKQFINQSQLLQHQSVSKNCQIANNASVKCFVCAEVFTDAILRYLHMWNNPVCKQGVERYCFKCTCAFKDLSDKLAHLSVSYQCWRYEEQLLKDVNTVVRNSANNAQIKEQTGSQVHQTITCHNNSDQGACETYSLSVQHNDKSMLATDQLLPNSPNVSKIWFPSSSGHKPHSQEDESSYKSHDSKLSNKEETVATQKPLKIGQACVKCPACRRKFATNAVLILHLNDSAKCRIKVCKPSKVAKKTSFSKRIKVQLPFNTAKYKGKLSLKEIPENLENKGDSLTSEVSKNISNTTSDAEKLLKCDICGKEFRLRSELLEHYNEKKSCAVTLHAEGLPKLKNLSVVLKPVSVMCEACHLPFTDRRTLAEHLQLSQTCRKISEHKSVEFKNLLSGDETGKRDVKKSKSCEIVTGISNATSTVSITSTNDGCITLTEQPSQLINKMEESLNESRDDVHILPGSVMQISKSSHMKHVFDEGNRDNNDKELILTDLSSSDDGSDIEESASSSEDDAREYKCKLCSKTFTSRSLFVKHTKLNHHSLSKKTHCKVCTRKFSDLTGLQAHLLQFRFCFIPLTRTLWERKQGPQFCSMCEKVLHSPKDLRKHCFKKMTCRLRYVNVVLENMKGKDNSREPELSSSAAEFAVSNTRGEYSESKQSTNDEVSSSVKDRQSLCDADNRGISQVDVRHGTSNIQTVTPALIECLNVGCSKEVAVHVENHQNGNEVVIGNSVEVKQQDGKPSSSAPKSVSTTAKDKHSAEQSFPCMICSATFPMLRLLMEHSYQHVEETPISCERCNTTFVHYNQFVSHQAFHIRMDKDVVILPEQLELTVLPSVVERLLSSTFDASKCIIGNTGRDNFSPKVLTCSSVCLFCLQDFPNEKTKLDHISGTQACMGIMRYIVENKLFIKDPEGSKLCGRFTDPDSCEFCQQNCSDKISHYLQSPCRNRLEEAILRYRATPSVTEGEEIEPVTFKNKPKEAAYANMLSALRQNIQCTVCKKKFGNQKLLMIHQREHKHSSDGTLATDDLIKDIRDVPEEVCCLICKKYLKTLTEVEHHQSSCKHSLLLPRSLVEQADWDPRHLKCLICDNKYALRGYLVNHMMKEHCSETHVLLEAARHKTSLCVLCNTNILLPKVQAHFQQHINKFVMAVRAQSNLAMRAPSREMCILCNKVCFSRDKVLRHLRSHTFSDIFKLDSCDIAAVDLNQTQSSQGIHPTVMQKRQRTRTVFYNPGNCKLCHKRFSHPNYFKLHFRMAHKQYDPEMCEELFSLTGPSGFLKQEKSSGGIPSKVVQKNKKMRTVFYNPGNCKLCHKRFSHPKYFKLHFRMSHKQFDQERYREFFSFLKPEVQEKSSEETLPQFTQKDGRLKTVSQSTENVSFLPGSCKLCNNKYAQQKSFKYHFKKAHKQYDVKRYKEFFSFLESAADLKQEKSSDGTSPDVLQKNQTLKTGSLKWNDRYSLPGSCKLCYRKYSHFRSFRTHFRNSHMQYNLGRYEEFFSFFESAAVLKQENCSEERIPNVMQKNERLITVKKYNKSGSCKLCYRNYSQIHHFKHHFMTSHKQYDLETFKEFFNFSKPAVVLKQEKSSHETSPQPMQMNRNMGTGLHNAENIYPTFVRCNLCHKRFSALEMFKVHFKSSHMQYDPERWSELFHPEVPSDHVKDFLSLESVSSGDSVSFKQKEESASLKKKSDSDINDTLKSYDSGSALFGTDTHNFKNCQSPSKKTANINPLGSCKLCHKTFTNLQFFKFHLKKSHHRCDPEDQQKMFEPFLPLQQRKDFVGSEGSGSACSVSFKSEKYLPKVCRICQTSFSKVSVYQTHLRTHLKQCSIILHDIIHPETKSSESEPAVKGMNMKGCLDAKLKTGEDSSLIDMIDKESCIRQKMLPEQESTFHQDRTTIEDVEMSPTAIQNEGTNVQNVSAKLVNYIEFSPQGQDEAKLKNLEVSSESAASRAETELLVNYIELSPQNQDEAKLKNLEPSSVSSASRAETELLDNYRELSTHDQDEAKLKNLELSSVSSASRAETELLDNYRELSTQDQDEAKLKNLELSSVSSASRAETELLDNYRELSTQDQDEAKLKNLELSSVSSASIAETELLDNYRELSTQDQDEAKLKNLELSSVSSASRAETELLDIYRELSTQDQDEAKLKNLEVSSESAASRAETELLVNYIELSPQNQDEAKLKNLELSSVSSASGVETELLVNYIELSPQDEDEAKLKKLELSSVSSASRAETELLDNYRELSTQDQDEAKLKNLELSSVSSASRAETELLLNYRELSTQDQDEAKLKNLELSSVSSASRAETELLDIYRELSTQDQDEAKLKNLEVSSESAASRAETELLVNYIELSPQNQDEAKPKNLELSSVSSASGAETELLVNYIELSPQDEDEAKLKNLELSSVGLASRAETELLDSYRELSTQDQDENKLKSFEVSSVSSASRAETELLLNYRELSKYSQDESKLNNLEISAESAYLRAETELLVNCLDLSTQDQDEADLKNLEISSESATSIAGTSKPNIHDSLMCGSLTDCVSDGNTCDVSSASNQNECIINNVCSSASIYNGNDDVPEKSAGDMVNLEDSESIAQVNHDINPFYRKGVSFHCDKEAGNSCNTEKSCTMLEVQEPESNHIENTILKGAEGIFTSNDTKDRMQETSDCNQRAVEFSDSLIHQRSDSKIKGVKRKLNEISHDQEQPAELKRCKITFESLLLRDSVLTDQVSKEPSNISENDFEVLVPVTDPPDNSHEYVSQNFISLSPSETSLCHAEPVHELLVSSHTQHQTRSESSLQDEEEGNAFG